MEQRHDLDSWLDDALASYSNVAVPYGLEARMLGKLRERKLRRFSWMSWAWAGAPAVAIALILVIAAVPRNTGAIPPALHARIAVPEVRKVALAPVNGQPAKAVPVSTRGVPIVAVALNSQEEAILRMVRNARARQLATLTADRGDVRLEGDIIGFRELQIPPVTREEEK